MTDDNDDTGTGSAFPLTVRIAGVMWVAFGALQVLLAVVNFWAVGPVKPDRPLLSNEHTWCGCVGLLCGVPFAFAGATVVTGRARDTLGRSVASLIVGTLLLALAVIVVVVGVQVANAPRKPNDIPLPGAGKLGAVVGSVLLSFSLAYLLPGLLGLFGRRAYLAWRAHRLPPLEPPWPLAALWGVR